MSSINFSNPYLLLILIPLAAAIMVPFFVAIKKKGFTVYTISSLVLHTLMIGLAGASVAGTTYERTITETAVYVLADVSYSADENLDKIDQYIVDLKDNLPPNSKMGLVTFAKDYELTVQLGEEMVSVKESKCDNTETNIGQALRYTGTLFTDDVIKRIVIISDGKETNPSSIISVVSQLQDENIYIDAIYLDDNLKPTDKEIMVNGVDFNKSVFKDNKERLDVMIQSSYDVNGYVTLYKDGEEMRKKPVTFVDGLNTFDFELDTSEAGEFFYKVVAEVENDYCPDNNEYQFSQSVSDEMKTLFLSSDYNNQKNAVALYGDVDPEGKKTVDFFYTNSSGITQNINDNNMKLPITVEELCKYDQFVFADMNFREMFSAEQFLESVDTCVSEFGKSLVSIGNTFIQTDMDGEDVYYQKYQNMLPVKYGASATDKKLVTIILDISKSMLNYSRVLIARAAACKILDVLEDNDVVAVIEFSGNTEVLSAPVNVGDHREELKEKITGVNGKQGTFMSAAMQQTLAMIKDLPYESKEAFLISDGLPFDGSYTVDGDIIGDCAKQFKAEGIALSTINSACNTSDAISLMKKIAAYGGGQYFEIMSENAVDDVVLGQVATQVTESEVKGASYTVNALRDTNALFEGVDIENIEKLRGFYIGKKKSNAQNVATVSYSKFNDERMTDVPLFTYWNYGNGVTYSFGTSFTNSTTQRWCMNWFEEGAEGIKILKNILPATVPQLKHSTPYMFDVETEGTRTTISVHAPSVGLGQTLTLNVKLPDGTTSSRILAFDLVNYVTMIDTTQVGRYELELLHTRGEYTYTANTDFYIAYPPEFNRFETFDSGALSYMVTTDGVVSTDGKLKLNNDNVTVSTYVYDFTPSFMTAAVVLFVIDVFMRKIKWADLQALFGKKKMVR